MKRRVLAGARILDLEVDRPGLGESNWAIVRNGCTARPP